MEKKTATSVIITFMLIALMQYGCENSISTVTKNVLKSYSGHELLFNQALLMKDSDTTVSFLSVDGKYQTDTGLPFKFASGILLLPGVHNVLVSFKYKHYAHLNKSTVQIAEWSSVEPQIVRVVVEVGHAYQINPGVNFRDLDAYTKIASWVPYLDDVTNNYPMLICKVPKHRFARNLKSRFPITTYSLEPPNSDDWVMIRTKPSKDSRSLLPLLFNKVDFGTSNTSIPTIFINIYNWDSTINLPSFDANGFEKFINTVSYDFKNQRNFEEALIQIDEYEVDSVLIGTKYWKRCKYHSNAFIKEYELRSSSESIAYITNFNSGSISDYVIISLSQFQNALSDEIIQLSENDIKLVTKIVESFQCTIDAE